MGLARKLLAIFIFMTLGGNTLAQDMLEHCKNNVPQFENDLSDIAIFINTVMVQKCVEPDLTTQTNNVLGVWAQQMIGTDLVKETIQSQKIKPKKIVAVGVYDTQFNESCRDTKDCHGLMSSQMIGKDAKFGISSFVKLKEIDRIESYDISAKSFSEKFDNSDVISFSQYHTLFHDYGYRKGDLDHEMYREFNSEIIDLLKRKPFVIPSGNGSAENGEAHVDKWALNLNNAIVVGAASSNGMPNGSTNKSLAVTVYAPGDLFRSSDKDFYSSTSGAAPIVTGVIADSIALAGDLSGSDIKTMLKNTSTPMPIQKLEPDRNGYGLVNHYKMFRVAQRLQEKTDWPANRKYLNDPDLYRFDKEVEELEKGAIESLKKFDCNSAREAIDKLRKAFFLKPTDLNRTLLSQIYTAIGFNRFSEFYRAKNSQDVFLSISANTEINYRTLSPDQKRLIKTYPDIAKWHVQIAEQLNEALIRGAQTVKDSKSFQSYQNRMNLSFPPEKINKYNFKD